MDEVRAWSKDLQIFQAIKGQRYQIFVDVYTVAELDLIDVWIEKVADNNKVMETLHAKIHRLKDQAREQILEVEKHYSDACLRIFEDEEREKLFPIEVVVGTFKNIFEEVANDEDIQQAFRTEEALLELDTKLEDFIETQVEVNNYR